MTTRPPTPEELRFHCFVGKNIDPGLTSIYSIFFHFFPRQPVCPYNFGETRHVCSVLDSEPYAHPKTSSISYLATKLQELSQYPRSSPYLLFIYYPEVGFYIHDHGDFMDEARSLYETYILPDSLAYLWFFTHQPLIVNEFDASEVTLVTGPISEPSFHVFSSLPGYDIAKKVYALGEFWLSYSDGTEEEKCLLQGLPRP